MSPAFEAYVAMLAKAMYMIQEGRSRAYAIVSRLPNWELRLTHIIKTEVATDFAKRNEV
jgi:hypothetical protein